MKRIFTIAAALIMTGSVWAQSPEKMSYQAVLRDAGNTLVTSQSVGMQISILQGGATGTAVYVETQTPSTNTNGLVSIEIGTGTVVSGDFTTIDWANDTYFIKTETDPTGGATYTITGTSQLMSVPYALHANTADSIVGGVSITETDPIFGASVSNGITAIDTANWNNHTVDSDTQLDSTDIAVLGFVAGTHTVDTDTHIDSTGVAALGYVAGGITTEVDGSVTNELQTMSASASGDTLYLSQGNFLIIPGLSAANFVCGGTLTDSRDGNTYATVEIGGQCWLAQNLRYNVPGVVGGSDTLNALNPSAEYGRHYDWPTIMAGSGSSSTNPSGVQGICPDGWHVPSDAEWTELETTVGVVINSDAPELKSTTGWNSGNGTNTSGFNAFPPGQYLTIFQQLGDLAYYWSSTESSSSMAWSRYLTSTIYGRNSYDNATLGRGFSCRCVKD